DPQQLAHARVLPERQADRLPLLDRGERRVDHGDAVTATRIEADRLLDQRLHPGQLVGRERALGRVAVLIRRAGDVVDQHRGGDAVDAARRLAGVGEGAVDLVVADRGAGAGAGRDRIRQVGRRRGRVGRIGLGDRLPGNRARVRVVAGAAGHAGGRHGRALARLGGLLAAHDAALGAVLLARLLGLGEVHVDADLRADAAGAGQRRKQFLDALYIGVFLPPLLLE